MDWRHSFVGCLHDEEGGWPCWRQEGDPRARPRRKSWVGSRGRGVERIAFCGGAARNGARE